MTAISTIDWDAANQRYLAAEVARVRAVLERRASGGEPGAPAVRAEIGAAFEPAPALEALCSTLGLSPFERDVLLLCAGVELDATFARLCGPAGCPTFSLALAALPRAHWSALQPNAPLRHWRLIELGAGGLTTSPLRIDEWVLHYLTGARYLDERLGAYLAPLASAGLLAPSHAGLAERLALAWERAAGSPELPAAQLYGADPAGQRAVAAAACALLDLGLYVLPAAFIPLEPREQEALIRLWERQAALGAGALLIECADADPNDAPRELATMRLAEELRGIVVLSGRERRHAVHRPMLALEVLRPPAGEQRDIWRRVFSARSAALDEQIDRLVAQFSLSTPDIQALAGAAAAGEATQAIAAGEPLWEACRAQARPRLDSLAQRIEPGASWDDLVLPENERRLLRDIAIHVRCRQQVYERWGFAARYTRGLGISALFAGPSGTGKTMAAEVLANQLRLDLYRIDLSQVVSKYVGETEKNLRRVFDAAEESGAILLFDEADALFGKRSDVKDSHDRYANIEISYLLQRMESYRGLAILTTNLKSALDTAFLRRIRFAVHFPFPDCAQRAEIWRHVFPAGTPTQGLDMAKLARLNMAGGNIRNIALGAAFTAADAGKPVGMAHLLQAARAEYAKLEKSLTDAEVAGWV